MMSDMRLRCVEPHRITYNAAISACEISARWHEALGMSHEFRLRCPEPDVVTYNAAIGACESDTGWHEALGMFSDRSNTTPEGLRALSVFANAATSITTSTPL